MGFRGRVFAVDLHRGWRGIHLDGLCERHLGSTQTRLLRRDSTFPRYRPESARSRGNAGSAAAHARFWICRTLAIFHGIPWYPAYGDGACNSIGSGCSTPQRFALMVGTSGAMRVVVKENFVTIPSGIWCYRVNRERFILGGAISKWRRGVPLGEADVATSAACRRADRATRAARMA